MGFDEVSVFVGFRRLGERSLQQFVQDCDGPMRPLQQPSLSQHARPYSSCCRQPTSPRTFFLHSSESPGKFCLPIGYISGRGTFYLSSPNSFPHSSPYRNLLAGRLVLVCWNSVQL